MRGNGGQDDLNTESNAAGGGADVRDGGPELDILQAGPGSDTLIGGTGNDRLVGGLGADKMNAGSGTGDVVAYEGRTARVVVILDDQPNDGEAGEGDKITNAEIIQGGRGPDTMIGDDKANIFEGFDGDDVLIGGRGADDLRGGTGNDRLASNDLFGVRSRTARSTSSTGSTAPTIAAFRSSSPTSRSAARSSTRTDLSAKTPGAAAPLRGRTGHCRGQQVEAGGAPLITSVKNDVTAGTAFRAMRP